eukprot:TRINITY_DN56047_c0_g1_i1.p1 TRINITY_DN56047_c0_g1~~TRINITY_DN56047_c0_g1_i1.p1  ORF type:complete len:263 (+),score=36.36 TRINITY_DN56047_c0_g1_i1:74-862(+)
MAARGQYYTQPPSTGVYGGANSMGDFAHAVSNHEGVVGIERSLKWRLLFFAGACCVFAAGVISVVVGIFSFGFVKAPAIFFSQACLLVFGILMIVLDLPTHHLSTNMYLLRDMCYRFLLFLTRFTGRGVWYIWLGSMAFVALYDEGSNVFMQFLGVMISAYVVLLGFFAGLKGLLLSAKLNRVHNAIIQQNRDLYSFVTPGSTIVTKQRFRTFLEEVACQAPLFSDADMDYIINALKFEPYGEDVSMEELQYWLSPGPILLI